MTKKTFRVPDMHCPNCPIKIESIENDISGISDISASYHKLQVVVVYDETKLNEAQIIEAIRKKGYTAEPA